MPTPPVAVLASLAEPSRLRILELLARRPRSVGEIVERTGLTQPGASKHLRVLRDAGLVRARVQGKQRVYELRLAPLRQLDGWLETYRRLWSKSLDRLEQALEEDDEG